MTPRPQLRQCPGCRWYTRQLQQDGRCLDCTGWTHCPQHVRLEHAGSAHRAVTVHEVVTTLRKRSQPPPAPTTGPRGVSAPR